ncbi:MAG: hypothetical protein CMJ58_01565 [Planctomycetaceae bacterium]|nr:hypothetical protein [Planctomycetaceae bacterium]
MNKKSVRISLVACGTLLLLAGGAWGLGWFDSSDPIVDELKSMMTEGPPTREQGEAMRRVIDERTEGMTDDEKREFFREKMMPVFVSMMAKRFSDEYDAMMAMSPEERTKELDRRIDEMQEMRNRSGGPPQGRGGPPSPARVNEFRVKMLDMISPDQRTKLENGMQMMRNRMDERGIQVPPGPGGGFF